MGRIRAADKEHRMALNYFCYAMGYTLKLSSQIANCSIATVSNDRAAIERGDYAPQPLTDDVRGKIGGLTLVALTLGAKALPNEGLSAKELIDIGFKGAGVIARLDATTPIPSEQDVVGDATSDDAADKFAEVPKVKSEDLNGDR